MAQSPARSRPARPGSRPIRRPSARLPARLAAAGPDPSGQLGPGDRLPGVRELASGTGVNVNTARAVYGRLEEDGLIVSRHGLGTFVSEGPGVARARATWQPRPPTAPAPAASILAIWPGRSTRAAGRASQAASSSIPARASGLEVDRAGERASRSRGRRAARPARAAPPDRPPRGPACLLSRRRPQARRAHPPAAAPQGARRRHGGAGGDPRRPDGTAEAGPRGCGAPRPERQRRARSRVEEMVSEPAAHKWETVSKQELGEPGCASWDVQPRWGPVGALMNWWRVKVSSGCPLTGPSGDQVPA